ncbi:tetratricopeptide repeat protein [Kouleothrix sp.]|uniref:tetratricopeptide repeat protein n=1 Tax=Kouleothrix sp. TaxID=2779161 RepID=UPI00391DE01E
MSDDLARLLYDGAVAVREGRRADAQGLLMRVIERDEANELAWLWLSGAVDDPADQQVALENVLALNPGNTAARQGLELLRARQASAPAGEWVPPPPRSADEVDELACYQCGASVYSVAAFCWQCHAPVHCCNNCAFRNETRCKELQGLTSTMAQAGRNQCEWWRAQA